MILYQRFGLVERRGKLKKIRVDGLLTRRRTASFGLGSNIALKLVEFVKSKLKLHHFKSNSFSCYMD
jgi:hypothetical protein